jgi:dimethylamine/trimethylamine dehydrogenase
VALATGATWRRSGIGRSTRVPIPGYDAEHVLSAEDILNGARPGGRVVVYDDDYYYMGAVVASTLAAAGAEVTVVTPVGRVADWSYNTDEQIPTQMRLQREGVRCETLTLLSRIGEKSIELFCTNTGDTREFPADHVVMVTSREPTDALYCELRDELDIERVGDCGAPGIIASAVMAGHRYAREMDAPAQDVPFRRDDAVIVD